MIGRDTVSKAPWQFSLTTALCVHATFVIISTFPSLALADGVLKGPVVRVIDGDTITILVSEKEHKVRLAEIDAPEKKQPFGKKSKMALSEKVFAREVQVHYQKRDRYGRVIGTILVDGENVNHALVREGYAWVYRKYSNDPQLLILEDRAKAAAAGLWGLQADQRIAPWQWRRNRRK